MCGRIEREACNTWGEVASLCDFDAAKIKGRACRRRTAIFLEEVVRAVRGHVSEIRVKWGEGLVSASGKEKVELAPVGTKHIDLFVMQAGGTNELAWSEGACKPLPERSIGGEVPVLGEPAGKGSRA